MYKLLRFPTVAKDSVLRIEDNAFIPFDVVNTDYQAYLKWLDDGNVPLSSEEGNTPKPANDQQNS